MIKHNQYRELFERSADAILIIRGDRFVDCNDATVRMLRYRTKRELLNTHPSELSPPVQPDGRLSYEKANEMMAIAFAQGTHRFEWDHLRADGEVFPVEVLLTAFEEDGEPVLHVVWREISDRKQAEEELRRLTSIIESTSDLVSTADPDGRITYLNTAGRIMLGWPQDLDISGRKIPDLHPEWAYITIRDEGIPHTLRHGLWTGETAIRTMDGKEIPVSQVIMSHAASHGKLAYFSTIMRDISGPKHAERFLTSIIDTIPDPIFVKNDQLRFVAFNKALCEFVGYSREELLGKSDFDFFPHEQATVFRAKDELVLQSGKENVNEELITDSSGEVHTISTKKSSFADDSGNRFLVGVIRDISELKRVEKQLQDNLHLLNSIIENQPTCVKLINARGEVLEMNPSGLHIFRASSRDEIIGCNLSEMIVEEDRERFRQFNEDVCRGEKRDIRFTIRDLQGSLHHMDSIAVPLKYGTEEETVQLAISRDVTADLAMQEEQERLKNSLRQSQKMEAIGTLAGGIAHDFNNILSAILGYAELALLAEPEDGVVSNDIMQILKAGQRAKELVSRILTFSRKSDQEYRPLRICKIVKETLELLRASLPTTITIEQDILPDCPAVLADPAQIQQLVMNLCTNAFYAMKSHGGRLEVKLQRLDPHLRKVERAFLNPDLHYLVLEVNDTGCGMEQDALQRIFEPYFTTKGKGEGTGLGLSVVHGIVQSYGGHISVVSAIGKGTAFRVFLPCLEESPAELEEDEAQAPGGTERVLVVDDEPMLVDIVERLLKRLGYQVTTTTSSEDALQRISQEPDQFDLLVSDLTMPVLTGIELANRVRGIRPDLPIIICTGYNSSLTSVHVKELDIEEVISKPVQPRSLAVAVRKALDRRKGMSQAAG